MSRLFLLTIAAILAYMFWRIVRIVLRGSRGRDGVDFTRQKDSSPPAETFHDVRDARFEDLKGPAEENPDKPRS